MVAAAATSNASRDGGNAAATASKHGAELVHNLRIASKVAGVTTSTIDSSNDERESTRRARERAHESQTVARDGLQHHHLDDIKQKMTTMKDPNLRSIEVKESLISKNLEDEKKTAGSASSHMTTMSNAGTSLQNENSVHETNTTQLKEGNAVPSTRIGRALGFASLGVGLAAGTTFEVASRLINRVVPSTDGTERNTGSPVANDANADRLVQTLCRMRGAALKLGQMLSIQDETLLPPALAKALEQVRQGADSMPVRQLRSQMEKELGEDWRDRFQRFDDLPFAAASIGQVHRASVRTDHSGEGTDDSMQVVVKVQYPGVANSIESDLSNLSMLITMSRMAPPGLFIERVIDVGRKELTVECDYIQEMENQKKMKKYIQTDKELTEARFVVPNVIEDLSTAEVLTTEYCPGGTIDKVMFLDQDERNRIARNILRLTMKELFVWRFMQTDPNWGNFLYDVGTGTTYLIDFGSTLEYNKSFVDGYLRIVWASANRDADTLMNQSRITGFLTGDENDIMLEAHKMSGFTMGDPFVSADTYDFGGSGITGRMSEHGSAFLQHRLTPPPEEVYTLHRKLVGAYNLCIKLGAKIKCRDLLEEIVKDHVFEDGQDHPLKND